MATNPYKQSELALTERALNLREAELGLGKERALTERRSESMRNVVGLTQASASLFGTKAFLFLLAFIVLWGMGGNIVKTIFSEVPIAIIVGVIAVWFILK